MPTRRKEKEERLKILRIVTIYNAVPMSGSKQQTYGLVRVEIRSISEV